MKCLYNDIQPVKTQAVAVLPLTTLCNWLRKRAYSNTVKGKQNIPLPGMWSVCSIKSLSNKQLFVLVCALCFCNPLRKTLGIDQNVRVQNEHNQ